jgi:anaerobic magnesium-protoporphyrin IX monomethyl ester cyclase
MKVLFIYPIFESLGIEYLSAYLKRHGHQTELALDPLLFGSHIFSVKSLSKMFSYRKNLLDEIVSAKPDMVCFSCVSDYFPWAANLAQNIKEILDVPIVFGGPHPTSVPENVLKHEFIDFIVMGEGEDALLELANGLESGEDVTGIRNLCYKADGEIIKNPLRPLIADLNSLPFPDKELYYKRPFGFINVGGADSYIMMCSRGCIYACSFCYNNYLRKLYKGSSYLRTRCVDNVIEELLVAKKRYKFRKVSFWDEMFAFDKKWLREFSGRYKKEIGLPFFCYTHPAAIDRETVELLEEAGCRLIALGIQSLNENIRKEVLSRYESNDDIINAIKLIPRKKIFLYVELIVGLPRETENDLLWSAEFFNKYRVDLISMLWLRHFPKTDIMMYLKDQQMITKINEGIIYAPFQTIGTSFDKDKARLVNLILLANLIPSSCLRFILKNKLYRYFPSKSFRYASFFLSALITKMFYPKKYVYPPLRTPVEYLYYHVYYIWRYFSRILKGSLRKRCHKVTMGSNLIKGYALPK